MDPSLSDGPACRPAGTDVPVIQISQESMTLSRVERVSLMARAELVSRPPSRNSIIDAHESIVSLDTSVHSHPVLPPLSISRSSTHLAAPEIGHIAYTPLSDLVEANVTGTTLPAHQSPILAGERPTFQLPWHAFTSYILSAFLRKLYHVLFLGIPVFYMNRVHLIFKEVRLSTDDVMKKIIETLAESQAKLEERGHCAPLSAAAFFVPAEDNELHHLKTLWEGFIEQSIREWKTANLVSILLLSTIIGTLQITEALSDSVVRTTVLMSLICALMSLIYGCVYTVRFWTMRRVHKALQWAKEGERTGNDIFWNTWVLLAMPVTWLSWSLILYIIGIMAFVWRAEPGSSDSPSLKFGLASRIAITSVLFIGVVYFVIIMLTLNGYGGTMDGEWREKVRKAAAKQNIVIQKSFANLRIPQSSARATQGVMQEQT